MIFGDGYEDNMVQVDREMYGDEYINDDDFPSFGSFTFAIPPRAQVVIKTRPQPTSPEPTERQGRCPACQHETTLVPGIRTWYCKPCCELEREALRPGF